jgi:hypothetical protein
MIRPRSCSSEQNGCLSEASLNRRFYSPSLLPESPAAELRVWGFETRLRAAAVRYASVGTRFGGRGIHGPARTAGVGAVTPTVLPGFLTLTCHFRLPTVVSY